MTKMNWNKPRKTYQRQAGLDAADKWLAQFDQQKPRSTRKQRSPRRKPRTDADGIWIVSHASGDRVVHHFKTLKDAHDAGFDWAL